MIFNIDGKEYNDVDNVIVIQKCEESMFDNKHAFFVAIDGKAYDSVNNDIDLTNLEDVLPNEENDYVAYFDGNVHDRKDVIAGLNAISEYRNKILSEREQERQRIEESAMKSAK